MSPAARENTQGYTTIVQLQKMVRAIVFTSTPSEDQEGQMNTLTQLLTESPYTDPAWFDYGASSMHKRPILALSIREEIIKELVCLSDEGWNEHQSLDGYVDVLAGINSLKTPPSLPFEWLKEQTPPSDDGVSQNYITPEQLEKITRAHAETEADTSAIQRWIFELTTSPTTPPSWIVKKGHGAQPELSIPAKAAIIGTVESMKMMKDLTKIQVKKYVDVLSGAIQDQSKPTAGQSTASVKKRKPSS